MHSCSESLEETPEEFFERAWQYYPNKRGKELEGMKGYEKVEKLMKLVRHRLLVIDDFGIERQTSTMKELVYKVINMCYTDCCNRRSSRQRKQSCYRHYKAVREQMFLKCDDWRCTINLYIIAFRVIVERLLSHLTMRYSEKRVGEIRLFFLCDKLERINAHNQRVHVPSVLVQ